MGTGPPPRLRSRRQKGARRRVSLSARFSCRGEILGGLERGRTEELYDVGVVLRCCPKAIEVGPRRVGFGCRRLGCVPVEGLAASWRLQRENACGLRGDHKGVRKAARSHRNTTRTKTMLGALGVHEDLSL